MAKTKLKILIIESDLVFRRSLYKVLSKNDYTVFVAANDTEARELCEQMQFHLVIIDIRYSSTFDIECLRHLRVLHPDSKVIIISTFRRREFEKNFLTTDFDSYLMKPVKRVELLKTVRQTLLPFSTV
ncbi:MAG: response regulator [Deferribacteres bacterium]|nr:response regulator [candidate division KSB1 bacterium]MCB9500426.1 response regulator [Deferribacteres bacterium]